MKSTSCVRWGAWFLLTIVFAALGALLCSYLRQGTWTLVSICVDMLAVALMLQFAMRTRIPFRMLAFLVPLTGILAIGFIMLLTGFVRAKVILMIWAMAPLFFALPILEWPMLLTLNFRQPDPHMPDRQETSQHQKVGLIWMTIYFTAVLIPLAIFTYEPFWSLVTGRFLADQVKPLDPYQIPNTGLTPITIKVYFCLFMMSAMVVFPHLALARWICDRTSRLSSRVFAVYTWAVRMCMLGILTLPYYWLIQYTLSMGITAMRVCGLLLGLGGFLLVLGFNASWLRFIPLLRLPGRPF